MLRIENFGLGVNATFKGWDLIDADETGDKYVWRWEQRGRRKAVVFLYKKAKSLPLDLYTLEIMDYSDGKTVWKQSIGLDFIRTHWQFVDKCIWLMEKTII
jgi:hypothetical protein